MPAPCMCTPAIHSSRLLVEALFVAYEEQRFTVFIPCRARHQFVWEGSAGGKCGIYSYLRYSPKWFSHIYSCVVCMVMPSFRDAQSPRSCVVCPCSERQRFGRQSKWQRVRSVSSCFQTKFFALHFLFMSGADGMYSQPLDFCECMAARSDSRHWRMTLLN